MRRHHREQWEEHLRRHWEQHHSEHLRGRLRGALPEWMWMRFRIHAHLQRRLFWWLVFTILVTGGAVFALGSFVMSDTGWRHEVARLRSFAAGQFAEVWSDAPRRDALGTSIARDLDLDVVLKAPDGTRLAVFGTDQCRHPWAVMDVARDTTKLGTASFCLDRHMPVTWWRIAIGAFVVFMILGVMSGRIARRLARPLSELARVAQELGQGRLKSRFELGWHTPGEIAVLGASFNEMAERIERQVADQRELMAGVSHELRTPLARIRLLVELIRDAGGGGARLDEVEREILEIDALVGELLASARLDFAALVRRPLDAAEITRKALERGGLDPQLAVVDTRDTAFEADATLIARALANLIENARRHAGGLVRLHVLREGTDVVFAAEDKGPGFPPDPEGRVFTPFAPKSNGEPREAGSLGLGLALVKRIAEAHGGQAFAENRLEGGARVGIRIPAKAP